MHETTALLAFGVRDFATPALAWTTTGLYAALLLLACLLIRARARHASFFRSMTRVAVWCGVFATIFALSIDHRAKVSRTLVSTIRGSAHEGGWYEHRYLIQGVGVGLVVLAGVFIVRKVLRRGARLAPGYRTFGLGIVALVLFVLVREVSLHHIDSVMGLRVATLSVGRIGETAILLATSVGAARWARHSLQAAAA